LAEISTGHVEQDATASLLELHYAFGK